MLVLVSLQCQHNLRAEERIQDSRKSVFMANHAELSRERVFVRVAEYAAGRLGLSLEEIVALLTAVQNAALPVWCGQWCISAAPNAFKLRTGLTS